MSIIKVQYKGNPKMQKELITKEILVSELLEKYPQTAPILMSYGLHCVGCVFSSFDTLENGIKIHRIDDETFEMLLKDLNKAISEN